MPRYKLTLEYDGSPFAGWQRQADAPSVQGAIEAAAERLDEAPVTVQGAGRTDAGVHALGQVAHLDLVKDLPTDTVRDALNHHLRADPVAVLDAERVGEDFHARYSATARHYLYRLIDRRPPLTLLKGQVWRIPVPLDVAAMHDAAQCLVGLHDFSTFRDAQCQSDSPVKTLDAIAVERVGEEIHLTCSARSFLHRQVRSFTGSLVEVGWGKWSARDFRDVLEAADRSRCGPVAPPDGLYLTRVDYPASA
ncbi:tRNA pseudouridine(38-40) synthase TruA [Hyphobacterium marinum]|uniref:tRNA pseudouridine synthase A n=1 Tax=Hyphobacterium marinum TaxID=3116574 RepID=A0ABU7LWA4_9PROT|nr:tRNA pseudouridine(38-40) synthase TruA [Hyphobacterium sp. Y6023]MEE2565826.1 tRNA pseudouridine(38-40) synthase TruA [Hyphobacterium sp. Y6023]